jgi:hypothetical protein
LDIATFDQPGGGLEGIVRIQAVVQGKPIDNWKCGYDPITVGLAANAAYDLFFQRFLGPRANSQFRRSNYPKSKLSGFGLGYRAVNSLR